MLIDWFTVVAQLINFVILVVALKFLLYDKIVEAMEERRRSIAADEEEAQRRRREVEEEAAQLEDERRDLESRREDMLEEARRTAEERRREMLAAAREHVAEQEEDWLRSLRAHQERLLDELERATGRESMAIARRVLADLAGADLQEMVVRTFLDELDSLPDDDRSAIADAIDAEGSPLLVHTAFELSADSRELMRKGLRELAGNGGAEIEWERDPELIAGIVVNAGARTVSWSVDAYLGDLGERLAEVVTERLPKDDVPQEGEDESPAEDAEEGHQEGPQEES